MQEQIRYRYIEKVVRAINIKAADDLRHRAEDVQHKLHVHLRKNDNRCIDANKSHFYEAYLDGIMPLNSLILVHVEREPRTGKLPASSKDEHAD